MSAIADRRCCGQQGCLWTSVRRVRSPPIVDDDRGHRGRTSPPRSSRGWWPPRLWRSSTRARSTTRWSLYAEARQPSMMPGCERRGCAVVLSARARAGIAPAERDDPRRGDGGGRRGPGSGGVSRADSAAKRGAQEPLRESRWCGDGIHRDGTACRVGIPPWVGTRPASIARVACTSTTDASEQGRLGGDLVARAPRGVHMTRERPKAPSCEAPYGALLLRPRLAASCHDGAWRTPLQRSATWHPRPHLSPLGAATLRELCGM